MSSDLSNWLPLTSFIPFHELFASSPLSTFKRETAFLGNASYNPVFSLNLKREFGSKIYDLFLPYSIETAFSSSFTKADDSYSSENSFSFTLKQSAINMFGRFGVYNTFDFYESEDISSSLQFVLSSTDSSVPGPEELVYQDYISFYGKNNSLLSLENRLEVNFPETFIRNTFDFKLHWQRDKRPDFSWQFINKIIKKEHFWSHEDSLQLDLGYPWEESDTVEGTYMQISVKHLSQVTVPGLGALRGWLSLGFYDDEELLRAGFEAGMELEMSF